MARVEWLQRDAYASAVLSIWILPPVSPLQAYTVTKRKNL